MFVLVYVALLISGFPIGLATVPDAVAQISGDTVKTQEVLGSVNVSSTIAMGNGSISVVVSGVVWFPPVPLVVQLLTPDFNLTESPPPLPMPESPPPAPTEGPPPASAEGPPPTPTEGPPPTPTEGPPPTPTEGPPPTPTECPPPSPTETPAPPPSATPAPSPLPTPVGSLYWTESPPPLLPEGPPPNPTESSTPPLPDSPPPFPMQRPPPSSESPAVPLVWSPGPPPPESPAPPFTESPAPPTLESPAVPLVWSPGPPPPESPAPPLTESPAPPTLESPGPPPVGFLVPPPMEGPPTPLMGSPAPSPPESPADPIPQPSSPFPPPLASWPPPRPSSPSPPQPLSPAPLSPDRPFKSPAPPTPSPSAIAAGQSTSPSPGQSGTSEAGPIFNSMASPMSLGDIGELGYRSLPPGPAPPPTTPSDSAPAAVASPSPPPPPLPPPAPNFAALGSANLAAGGASVMGGVNGGTYPSIGVSSTQASQLEPLSNGGVDAPGGAHGPNLTSSELSSLGFNERPADGQQCPNKKATLIGDLMYPPPLMETQANVNQGIRRRLRAVKAWPPKSTLQQSVAPSSHEALMLGGRAKEAVERITAVLSIASRQLRQAEDVDPRSRKHSPQTQRICDQGDPFPKPLQGGCCQACKMAAKKYTHYKDSDLVPAACCLAISKNSKETTKSVIPSDSP
eukprot:jgi/Botrbrau1/18016/Bobra.0062s0009.2